MKKRAHAAWLLAGWAAWGGTAADAADIPARKPGPRLGDGWPDKDFVGGTRDTVNPLLGIPYGQRLNERFTFVGDRVRDSADGNRFGAEGADVTMRRGGLEWRISAQQRHKGLLPGGPGLMKVDTEGGDVVDRLDPCPDMPKGAKTGPHDCPQDADGDGVFDGLDRCPDTPAGAQVDADGCPLKAAEPAAPRNVTLDGVNFDGDSARLRPESLAILDNAAATLKEWSGVKVEVAGHTDSVSSDAYNLKLSQRRAEAVRAYLVKRGVAAERLTAKGYGESAPVADNRTAAGRAKNRRVELVPQM